MQVPEKALGEHIWKHCILQFVARVHAISGLFTDLINEEPGILGNHVSGMNVVTASVGGARQGSCASAADWAVHDVICREVQPLAAGLHMESECTGSCRLCFRFRQVQASASSWIKARGAEFVFLCSRVAFSEVLHTCLGHFAHVIVGLRDFNYFCFRNAR